MESSEMDVDGAAGVDPVGEGEASVTEATTGADPTKAADGATPRDLLAGIVARLEDQDDLVQRLASFLRPKPTPHWYERSALVAFLGTLLAAVVPITTAVEGWIHRATELDLAAQELKHKQSIDYINSDALKKAIEQALDPDLSQIHRQRALRFLEKFGQNEALKAWVKEETKNAKKVESLGTLSQAVGEFLLPHGERPEVGEVPGEGESPADKTSNESLNIAKPRRPNRPPRSPADESEKEMYMKLQSWLDRIDDPDPEVQRFKNELSGILSDESLDSKQKQERVAEIKKRLEEYRKSGAFAEMEPPRDPRPRSHLPPTGGVDMI